jgi:hypothetical protein
MFAYPLMNQILCIVRERSGSAQRRNVLLTPRLLGLARACPPTLIAVNISLRSASAPQKFLDFLRAVRTIRDRERPLARNERLAHRRSTLGRNVRLDRVAPQRRSSRRSELSRGAVSHCHWPRDLTAERWLIMISL